MKIPSKAELRQFLRADSWTLVSSKDHERYEKRLDNGDVLRTKISRGTQELGDPRLWRHIRNDQLRVSEEEFWRAVNEGIPPDRSTELVEQEEPGIPAWLVNRLLHTVGLREDEISGMTLEEAHAAWLDFRSRPPQ